MAKSTRKVKDMCPQTMLKPCQERAAVWKIFNRSGLILGPTVVVNAVILIGGGVNTDLDAAIASPSEVKRAIIAHIESMDAAMTVMNGFRDAEMAKNARIPFSSPVSATAMAEAI